MTDIMVETVDFVQRRESSAVKQALRVVKALHDALALKREIALPVLPETRAAVIELEDEIGSLKLKLLRHHPEQQPPCREWKTLPSPKKANTRPMRRDPCPIGNHSGIQVLDGRASKRWSGAVQRHIDRLADDDGLQASRISGGGAVPVIPVVPTTGMTDGV